MEVNSRVVKAQISIDKESRARSWRIIRILKKRKNKVYAYTMLYWKGHVNVDPNSGIIKTQVCIDKQSGARWLRIVSILGEKWVLGSGEL